MIRILFLIALAGFFAFANHAMAQNSSLYQNPNSPFAPPRNVFGGNYNAVSQVQGIAPGNAPMANPNANAENLPPAMGLQSASWTYQVTAPPRVLREHDIVSIRVEEAAQTQATGAVQTRKNELWDAILNDWVALDGLTGIGPAPQTNGEPRIRGQFNDLFRSDATLRTRESMTFNIAAEIVEIRPNGTLVLEAHKTLGSNDNIWDVSLSGVCRADDIGPDNVILSRDIVDLNVSKQDRGHLRDGYRRGWMSRWIGTLNPF